MPYGSDALFIKDVPIAIILQGNEKLHPSFDSGDNCDMGYMVIR